LVADPFAIILQTLEVFVSASIKLIL